MGFFKKIFKPVSKVLDKIIPNEIKPALPYLSAFAPYMLGPGAAAGSWWQKALYNPALRAGIMGGTNIGAQLAQEGSEGDINALSAGLAALQGFGTAGGATSTLEGFKSPMTDFDPARSGIMKFKDKLLDYGITGANKLQSAGDLLGAGGVEPGLNLATLEAAALPAAQATGDLMYAQGKRDLKDLANDVVDDMGGGYSDSAYRAAIRKSMEAYGATEEEILESIIAAGYKSGGRVALKGGGVMNAKRGLVDAPGGYAGLEEIENMKEFRIANPNIEDVADYKGYYERKKNPQNYDKQGFEIKENVEEIDFGGIEEAVENVNEEVIEDKKDGILMEIAKVVFRLTPPGAAMFAAEEAIDMYNNLENEDKEKVQEFGKKALRFAGLPGVAASAGISIYDKFKENKMADGGRIGYRRGNVVQTAASEDAPFNQQRVLKEDLDTSGGVESIWGGLSELEEAQSKSEGIDKRRNIVDFEMDLTKRLREEYDLDWKTADKYASIINFYANYNPLGLSHKEEILEKGYTGNDEIILKELENTSNIQVFAQGGVASVLPKGVEADYRGGGFIPIGSKERADDVPARLSENEFVMTADAVRAAGGGNVNKGAKRMYNVMNNLEARA